MVIEIKRKDTKTMTKKEFEEIAGYEVNHKDYNDIIEPMYMATYLDKYDFVKCIDKKRFALRSKSQLISEAKKIAEHLFEICGHWCDYEAEKRFREIEAELENRFGGIWYEINGYEFEWGGNQRGCRYPKLLIFATNNGTTIKEYKLIKEH